MTSFIDYMKFECFKQFNGFGDEIDELIIEIFNTKLDIVDISNKSVFDFETEFFIDGEKFNFIGHKLSDTIYSIGFSKNSDFNFKAWDSKRFVGDVFTGVFESLRMLLTKKSNIKKIVFKTELNNKHLIKFYSSNIVKTYMKKNFKLSLIKETENE